MPSDDALAIRAPVRALELLLGQPWAIQPEAMEQILAIAQRLHDGPEALAARLGRPLENARAVTLRDGVAHIPVTGPIFRYANLFTEISGATSLELLARDIQTAIDDPQVRALVLEMDSPGGQATGIAELAGLIRAAPKPVVAYVDGMAASAAYWLAAAAQRMVLSPTAIVGSIGVVASYRPEKDGPIKVISSQSPLKQATPDTESGRAEMQRVVDDLAAVFVADVARYRNTSADAVLSDFGRGSVLVGRKAVAVGMADDLGSLESLIAGLTGAKPRGKTMSYQADLNAALGLPADASAEQAWEKIEQERELAKSAGRGEGAEAERARILAVREQLIAGHEALIERLAFDGQTTGEQAAVQVLAAERAQRTQFRAGLEQHTPPPLPADPGGGDRPTAETFEDKVAAHQKAGLSRGQAMMRAAAEHPALHQAWIAQTNGRSAA